MKKFLIKILFFISPVVLWVLFEGFSPVDLFTYRPWEAIVFKTRMGNGKCFYPEMQISMTSVGDLCHHTPWEVKKYETWTTDALGYRNDSVITSPDIIIIGDSFITGSGLVQDSTLVNLIETLSDNTATAYAIAPGIFQDYTDFYNAGTFKKPKLLVFSIVERHVPPVYDPSAVKKQGMMKKVLNTLEKYHLNKFIDRLFKMNSIEWAKSRLLGYTGIGVPGKEGSRMFFLTGKALQHNDEELYSTLEAVQTYKNYCDSLGIDFLFLPIPDKESVYYENVPFEKQPDYLFQLDSLVKANNINTINVLKIFNEYRSGSRELLYHLDDTHWNALGVNLTAEAVWEYFSTLN